MTKLKLYIEEYSDILDEIVKTKPKFYIWGNNELLEAFNKRVKKSLRLQNVMNVGKIMRAQKRYKIFRRQVVKEGHCEYIFVPFKRKR